MSPPRVLVAARSPVVAAGLAAMAAEEGSLLVVGTAVGLAGLAARVEELRPEVLLAALEPGDLLRLPPLSPDAASAAPRLVAVAPDAEPESAARLLRGGAVAVLPPDVSARALAIAVEAAAAGFALLDAAALERLLAAPAARAASAAPPSPGPPLTPREQEVLGLLAEGLGNRQIAARLGISAHTAKTHVAAVLAKLGASTRAEAVAEGLRSGRLLL